MTLLPKRSYICCNTGDWSVNVDATNLPVEKEFLWNFEQGKRVIYNERLLHLWQLPKKMIFPKRLMS